jgi:hypothetical protein
VAGRDRRLLRPPRVLLIHSICFTASAPDVFAELEITAKREGNLVLFSEKPFDLAVLRRAGFPRFDSDDRMRAARDRFAKDGVVYFVDVAGMIEARPVTYTITPDAAPASITRRASPPVSTRCWWPTP